MGLDDKAANTGQDLGGKVKEAAGKVTGDRDLEAEGKGDQAAASVKQAGEKVKDAVKNVFN
ncbi:CsbD family protein [Nakamurella sp.]|uniref:CsbD family protein n=1 Tax=Nakamurella sp. TaxID=1869182 RepID=UPI003B3B1C8D